MYCSSCGETLPERARFCPSCGAAVSAESAESSASHGAPLGTEDVAAQLELLAGKNAPRDLIKTAVDEFAPGERPEAVFDGKVTITGGPNYILSNDRSLVVCATKRIIIAAKTHGGLSRRVVSYMYKEFEEVIYSKKEIQMRFFPVIVYLHFDRDQLDKIYQFLSGKGLV